MGLIMLIVLGILGMPIFGGYLALAGTKEQRPLGCAVFVVGIIIWIMAGVI